MKQFQGRVICPGTCEAEALVSHGGFNTLASYQMALMFHDKQVKCGDQNNPDLYKKPMIGKRLGQCGNGTTRLKSASIGSISRSGKSCASSAEDSRRKSPETSIGT